MLIGSFSGLFSVSLQYLVEVLNVYAPQEFSEVVVPYLDASGSTNFSILFLVISLWSASIGFNALIRISNYAHSVDRGTSSFIYKRIKAIRVTLLFMMIILFSLAIVVYGEIIGNFITTYSNSLFSIRINIDQVWYLLRWPVSFFFFYVIIIYIYSSLPDIHIKRRKVMPGAFVATLGIIIASSLFRIYVTTISRYNLVYGSLSNIILLMLWLYIISFILILGILFNIAIEQTRDTQE